MAVALVEKGQRTFSTSANRAHLSVRPVCLYVVTLALDGVDDEIDVFLAGIFYAVLAWRTKGLEATMATHAANNLFLLILLFS